MKRILIIGAGFLQSFIIKEAKALGYYTLVLDKNSNSIGFKYADEYKAIDITNKELCLEYAKEKKIDGVLTAATDYGVLTTSYIAKELGLPGLDYNVAQVIKNKYRVRKSLFINKVDDMAQYFEINSVNDIELIKDKITYPVIVKPSDGSGSKGIQKVEGLEDLKTASKVALDNSLSGQVLIEDFISGKEFGVESFVYDGNIEVLSVLGKLMTNGRNYAELGHYIPSELEIEQKVVQTVKKAIKALNINFGSVNMDILITDDNKVFIIDIGARMGGNLIGSHLIPIGTGIKYMENIIKACAGDMVEMTAKVQKQSIATRLLALKPGTIAKLPDLKVIEDKYKVKILDLLELGKEIKEYRTNLDGMGYVYAISDELNDAHERVEQAKDLIDNKIIRQ